MPDPPILKRLCTVVIWKPPVQIRGVLQLYELKFINQMGQEKVYEYSEREHFHLTNELQREQNVHVQVSFTNW